ncbi:hypothetical protein ACODUL_10465 [Stenotrophomonas maltophilia]
MNRRVPLFARRPGSLPAARGPVSSVDVPPPTGVPAASPGMGWLRYHSQSSFECMTADMIELNPVRQRITDLTDRVLSLRGYL